LYLIYRLTYWHTCLIFRDYAKVFRLWNVLYLKLCSKFFFDLGLGLWLGLSFTLWLTKWIFYDLFFVAFYKDIVFFFHYVVFMSNNLIWIINIKILLLIITKFSCPKEVIFLSILFIFIKCYILYLNNKNKQQKEFQYYLFQLSLIKIFVW
jgi:hypothetical protein